MAETVHYRLHCATEGAFKHWRLGSGEAAPTTCPSDTAHTITAGSVTESRRSGPKSVEQTPVIGGPKTDLDGLGLEVADGKWGYAEYSVPAAMHIQGVWAKWVNAELGDYAWIVLIHPGGTGNPAAEAAAGQKDVDVGAGLIGVYDPAAGAKYIEFWDETGSEPVLKEIAKVASVSGNVVTCAANLAATHPVTEMIRARYDGYSPVRGGSGDILGGLRLLGDSEFMLRNESGMTNAVPAGLILALRVKAAVASRANALKLVLNFIFRAETT